MPKKQEDININNIEYASLNRRIIAATIDITII